MKRSLTNLLCGLQDGLRRRPDATEDIAPNDEYEKAYAAGTEVHDELVELLDGIEHGFRDAIDPRLDDDAPAGRSPAYRSGYIRGRTMAGAVRAHVASEGRRGGRPYPSTPPAARWEVVYVIPGPPGLHYVHLRGPHPPYIGETVVRPPPAC